MRSHQSYLSRKFLLVMGFLALVFSTMWIFAAADVSPAAWQAFAMVVPALTVLVTAWVGVQGGLIDAKLAARQDISK